MWRQGDDADIASDTGRIINSKVSLNQINADACMPIFLKL